MQFSTILLFYKRGVTIVITPKLPTLVLCMRNSAPLIDQLKTHTVYISSRQGRNWRVGKVGNCPLRFWLNKGATGQWRHAALLLAHPVLDSQLRPGPVDIIYYLPKYLL